VPEQFGRVLGANVSVVTPNKRALAGPLKRFKALKAVERRRGVHFFYETCVGAGLPIIVTLTDLIKSGDVIMQVEAVLSGTLSYIFNNYDGSCSFAQVVREAQNLGLTEPDPRDDLSGLDVGRKLLILAREIGWDLEFDDVTVQDLVPASAKNAKSVEEFYIELEKSEPDFKERLPEKGKGKLCYLASVKDGRATTSLQIVTPDHAFFGLSGSDNIIAFTTKRYSTRPLVVKGPGAGPDVTAAGVFADIIRVIQ
jgi:aspartokinase/homoserine dehydrogenase 1